MNNHKGFQSIFLNRLLSGALLNKSKLFASLLLGAALAINQASAQDHARLALGQADSAVDYDFVKVNLDWSARDHGFNEGALCGVNALQGISGISLPNVPFEYEILGNVWDRTSMMNAAQAAFRMGFVDAAVNTAVCSQIHNDPVHQALARRADLIVAWFSSR